MKTSGRSKQPLEMQPSCPTLAKPDHFDDIVEYVQDMERNRLRIGLRDNISQVLAASGIFAGLLDPVDDHQREIKQRMTEALGIAIEEIRKLTDETTGPLFQQTGLIDSINTLIDEIGLVSFEKVRFTCYSKNLEQLQLSKKIVVFKIIKESLRQIIATRMLKDVEIDLRFTDNNISVVFRGILRPKKAKRFEKSVGIAHIRDLVGIYKGNVSLRMASQRSTLELGIPL